MRPFTNDTLSMIMVQMGADGCRWVPVGADGALLLIIRLSTAVIAIRELCLRESSKFKFELLSWKWHYHRKNCK